MTEGDSIRLIILNKVCLMKNRKIKKKLAICFSLLVLLLMAAQIAMAYGRNSRLFDLEQFNVKKNSYTVLRTKSCPNCYLVEARFSGVDLTNANLRGANLIGATFIRATLKGANLSGAKIAGADFSGAQWTDGSICQRGSIGRCIKSNPQ